MSGRRPLEVWLDDAVFGENEAMDNQVQLLADGDGLAVIGEPTAVQRFLQRTGLWADSKELDLRRLKPLLAVGSDLTQRAAQIAAESGRWIKLTAESAQLAKEHGLMETKTPGVSHVMIGVPGEIQSWLQAEHGLQTVLTNPAALSSLAGIMAQAATQQATAEIADYLTRIDLKVDDVLRKQDDAITAQMIGAGLVIEEATTVRQVGGTVNEVTWGKVESTSETIASTQGYALTQLEALASKLEDATKMRTLAETTSQAETEAQKWLAVLARCSQLQQQLDVLELDRVLAVSPNEMDTHRLGLQAARRSRVELLTQYTEPLLDRIDAACGTANTKMVWNRTHALAVVESGNHVAAEVHAFHEALGIESVLRSWEPEPLEGAAAIGAQAIQATKDHGPQVMATGATLLGAAVLKSKIDGSKPDS